MSKKILLLFSILFVVFIVSGCASQTENAQPGQAVQDNSDIIFFYGQECPHCKNVEEYFTKNNTAEKIQFSQKEVYHNKDNAALMAEKSKTCGLSESELGVPMLWTKENKCLFGDKDIIDFFNQKIDANK